LFFPSVGFGIKFTWVGTALTATTGSVKQGNIAKDGGTVNMVKCDKCGTERKDGETVCSECGKTFEDKK
jgi:RecJ-like exonuclease